MIADLKPYPAMKDSGVEWLGEVPQHWEVRRGKNLFRCIDVRSETGEEELLTVSSERGVVPRRSANVTMFKAESYVGHKLCWPGDLVINSLWAWAGGLGVSSYPGIISTAYGVYRPKKGIDARFIHELVRSIPFHWELRVRSKGVWTSRLQLTDDSFLCAPFLLPPTSEQTAIVRFLDHVDRRVRRYVRAKQKLIELLEEQKQVIIYRAVTRGLDPNVRLKPSGTDWIGEIPNHWTILRVRKLLTGIDQGVSPQAEARLADRNSWGVLKSGCVNHGVFRQTEHKRLPSGFPIDPTIVVHEGDVLVSRACGTPELVGSVARVTSCDYKLILSDKTFRLNFRDLRMTAFFVAAMNASYFRNQVRLGISGAEGLANNLPLSRLRDFLLVVPPPDEAQRIAESLSTQTCDLESAIAKAEREIGLIREYRTRLIADVITGKVDVRHLVSEMGEIEEDLEPIEGDEGTDDEMPGEDVGELIEEAADAGN